MWMNYGLIIAAVLSVFSHVALSQSFVHRQQTGDLLDDDFPGQFDGTVAVVRPLSLCLEPAGFLKDRQEGSRETAGPEETKHHLIKSGLDDRLLTETVHTARQERLFSGVCVKTNVLYRGLLR